MNTYILGIDQSTQGTKALLFDGAGALIARADRPHRQLVDARGFVEHDPEEIYANTVAVVRDVVDKAGISKNAVAGVGISNQRETSVAWRADGKPICNAVVWQCGRAAEIAEELARAGYGDMVRTRTGIPLSPYFPSGKFAWILRHVPGAQALADAGELKLGTVDAFLVYRLTGGRVFRTDFSNASRTQLLHLETLTWDEELCGLFGVPLAALPAVTDSDGDYGETDFEGFFDRPVPICGVMGDSHGALFGQGCHTAGTVKATYGTGSSVMMNIGDRPVLSKHGLVTSLAWSMGGRVSYVLEGNINYTGAVISWLKDDLGLIQSPAETEALARAASPEDEVCLVHAFTGLGAPYWDSGARGVLTGISRTTGRAEIVRAALDCIAYQITDILRAMREDAGEIRGLRVDGGPTGNAYLMQFQSDIAGIPVLVPSTQELSGMGAAYAAGLKLGMYDRASLFDGMKRREYRPQMEQAEAERHYAAWRRAVEKALSSK